MGDFAGDVAFEASHDLVFGLAFGETPRHVFAGGLMAAQPHNPNDMQSAVGIAVTAPAESVLNGLPLEASSGLTSAKFGKGAVAIDPVLVATDGGQQRRGFRSAPPVI